MDTIVFDIGVDVAECGRQAVAAMMERRTVN